MHLISKQPKRIFTFGCSFTSYHWMTWPEVLAYDLNVPLYNYGKSGAGNLYISNMLAQANAKYKFTKDDLVIVSWTNVCREDRWINGGWLTPGNIFSQGEYDEKWVRKFVDPTGMLIRDLGIISLTKKMLEQTNCQHHFLSMVDIVDQLDQGGNSSKNRSEKVNKLVDLYSKELDFIQPSFFKVLWNNDIQANKFFRENKLFNNKFSDGHPLPEEQLKYMQLIFNNHKFKDSTILAVTEKQKTTIDIILKKVKTSKKHMAIYEFGADEKIIKQKSTLVSSIGDILL